ncbi:MAG TPA: phosphoadenylyl-sulfate reductase [Gammaproteobacteria bacterium]|jgi:phosphoadenosine phosphosulfate reductase|nr:phosphoadenylyl-sulfate reductase [Gammaproteobacteria bacterium]
MNQCIALSALPGESLAATNIRLRGMSAEARAAWALSQLPGVHALSSSFGIQAAVSLHLMTRLMPDIPVILIDTGYLFPETYRFIDQLTTRLNLNLKVYRPRHSAAWQEARYGRLWEQGRAGLRRYNRLNKVEPMRRALAELKIGTWYSGLRRTQSKSRAATPFVEFRNNRYKVHPIADWSSRDVWVYLKRHRLPYHPLWEQGYVSIGDVHTTRRWEPGMREEDTRFFGIQRECGLHSEV